MRVAVVTPTFRPYPGGTGRLAELDAVQLAALGHDTHVYAPATGAAPVDVPGVTVHALRPWLRVGNAALVPGACRLARQYELVVLHYPFFGGAEPLLAARAFVPGSRLLLAYHMDVIGTGLRRAAFRSHARLVLPAVLRAADRVLVTSLDYARSGDLAGALAATPERFRELPPSIDVERFRPGPRDAALAARLGLAPEDRVVSFVATLDRAHAFKGLDVLLAAVAQVPRARLLVVGDGELRRDLERRARPLGRRAIFAGRVSEAELPALHRLADVLALPSRDRGEAFGLVALEALASGVPVVASDLPGVRTVARDEAALRVPCGDVPALAHALDRLIADDVLRRRLGEAGRRLALEAFSPDARLERWRRILGELR